MVRYPKRVKALIKQSYDKRERKLAWLRECLALARQYGDMEMYYKIKSAIRRMEKENEPD